MPNISMKSSNYKHSMTLKYSYGVIEVFKLFFPALNRAWRKKQTEKIRAIFRQAILFTAHVSHVIPAYKICSFINGSNMIYTYRETVYFVPSFLICNCS